MEKHSHAKVTDEANTRVLGQEDREIYLKATRKTAEHFGPDSVAYR